MDKSDIRKYNDNKNKKMKYWKKTYPFINVKEDQYEDRGIADKRGPYWDR